MTTMVWTTTLFPLLFLASSATLNGKSNELTISDKILVEFPLNLEYLEAEFYLFAALGKSLDSIQPNLTGGGPSPIGVKRAKHSPLIRDIIAQFGLEEVGHVRAIKSTVPGFARPLLNLSKEAFANVMNSAFDRPLMPLFDPYSNDINFLLATYVIPYIGLTGYVGTIPELESRTAKQLIAGLLGIESGQDAVIRTLLYERAIEKVIPYDITVAEFTDRISELRNMLGHAGLKDEGLIVPASLGAEGRTTGNILSANASSLSYGRTPEEVLRILYQTGDEHVAGGFFPRGANGTIARKYLKSEKYLE